MQDKQLYWYYSGCNMPSLPLMHACRPRQSFPDIMLHQGFAERMLHSAITSVGGVCAQTPCKFRQKAPFSTTLDVIALAQSCTVAGAHARLYKTTG